MSQTPSTQSPSDPPNSPLTPQQREGFLRRQGWSPDLPQEQRTAIEREWPDSAIEEALLIGF